MKNKIIFNNIPYSNGSFGGTYMYQTIGKINMFDFVINENKLFWIDEKFDESTIDISSDDILKKFKNKKRNSTLEK